MLKQIGVESVRSLLESPLQRPSHEIDRARNMAEHWHWRSRTRQLVEDGFEIDPELEEF